MRNIIKVKMGNSFEFPILSVLSDRVSIDLFFRAVASQVFSAQLSLTSVFGMGTGGPSPLKTPTIVNGAGHILTYLIRFVKPERVLFLKHPFRCGTPSGTRTLDTLIKSQVLYQLS